MKTGLSFLLIFIVAFFLIQENGFAQCSFSKSKSIIIDNTKVAGSSDFVDFPVYLSITADQFKTTANGGLIENANGYDIQLMLKDCRCWLDFIIHSYDGATGNYEIYVTVPFLKATANTNLEIFYGNASVSTNPSSDTTYNSTRTADWITTQNENRNNPATFYSVGSQKEGDCTGPGGVDSMDGISNLVLWLKGDCGVEDGSSHSVLNGGAVGKWRDQSGYGKDAVEASNSPDYQTNQILGNPALNFTAANGDRILSSGISDADAYMIFIVAEPRSYASNNIGLIHAAPSGNAFSGTTSTKSIGMWVSNLGVFWGRLIQSNGTFVNYSQTSAAALGTYFIMTNYADGSSTTGQYIRGVEASASSSYNGTIQSWTDFGIGRQGTESWDGHIAEVIVYNRNLSESERGQVENYLASKYGTEIPRLTGTTGPGGIGEIDGSSKLEVWFDATDLDGDGISEGTSESGQENGAISLWADKSGHGYDLSTGSATFTDINAGLNNLSSVDFNGSSHYLQTASVDLASSNALEYFIVFDDAAVDAANNNTLVNWENSGGIGGFELVSRTNVGRLQSRHSTGGAYVNANLEGFTNSDPYVLNSSYGPSGRDHIRNGSSISSNATSITLNNPASAPLVFGRDYFGGGNYFAADIAEFISFSVELNGAEKEIVQQYLSGKYNITLSGTDYYTGHATDYILGIQGIGTSDGTLTESHVASNASGGLKITMANGTFNAANEYLFAGNNGISGGTSTANLTSIPTVEQRIAKVWYLDKTGTIDAKLTFNIQESVGTDIFPAGNGYVLLYSSTIPLDFQNYTADHSINPVVSDEDIAFIVPNAQLLDGYYTVGTTDAASNPLPIELMSFDAEVCQNEVCLEWITGTEIDNDFFEIERSINGKEWDSLGKIEGAGNSTDLRAYNFVDDVPVKGISYYRLKQTDFDGAYSYSNIERIEWTLLMDFGFYPNPVKNQLIITGENVVMYNLRLHQIDGKMIPVIPINQGLNQLKINLENLPKGIYFVTLEYQGSSHTERLIKID